MTSLDVLQSQLPLRLRPYTAYTYAYPHKTAYRPLSPVQSLDKVWATEDQRRLFLYVHVPFCEVRCGFCNLFTIARAGGELSGEYLAAVQRQMQAVQRALPAAQWVRLAIGGGTPTFLHRSELQQLFEFLQDGLGVDVAQIPISCEASPATIDRDKLQLLIDYGVDRLSMGIQSFDDAEAKAMGRPQCSTDVARALDLLDEYRFPIRNLDLIYGAENQTVDSFAASVEQAIQYGAEELFLYPLYVRHLTGLGKRQMLRTRQRGANDAGHAERAEVAEVASDEITDDAITDDAITDDAITDDAMAWDRLRQECYLAARQLLLAAGYVQHSMRNFSKGSLGRESLDYCCQTDGMLGLGCGARSYTRRLHYSGEYAVGVRAIQGILANYMRKTVDDFGQVDYGFQLGEDEQRRRFLLMSLLQAVGVNRQDYQQRFGTDPVADYPELKLLQSSGLAVLEPQRLRLTSAGLACSDGIGPWLYSAQVQQLSEEYQWQ